MFMARHLVKLTLCMSAFLAECADPPTRLSDGVHPAVCVLEVGEVSENNSDLETLIKTDELICYSTPDAYSPDVPRFLRRVEEVATDSPELSWGHSRSRAPPRRI